MGSVRRLALLACALIACSIDTRAQHSADVALMLAGLAERTQQYYDRFISIICTETVQTQDLKFNLAPAGRPRTTVYELSVSRDSSGKREHEFRVERTLQSVNGRPARKNQRAECTDPKTGTPEPLAFLLAPNQRRYRFTAGGRGKRSSGHSCHRLYRDTTRARARHVGRQLFRSRRRRSTGTRLVRSRDVRHRSGGPAALEAVSSCRCRTDSSRFGPPSEWKNLR